MTAEKKQQLKRQTVTSISGVMLVFLLVITTNPANASAFAILLLPLLVAVTVYSSVRSALLLFSNMTDQRQAYASMLASAGSIVLVALGSLRQLSLQDMLFTALLIGGLVFYIRKSSPVSQ